MERQPRPGNPPAGGPERRRYIRQPLFLDALLKGRGSRSFAGKIRDYCPSGLFFAWDEAQGAFVRAEDNPIARGDAVSIAFKVDPEKDAQSCELSAKVARVLDAGVGLAFDNPDTESLQALQRLANRNLRPASPVPRLDSPTPKADSRQIISRCKELAAIRISAMIEAFFGQADESLFIAARDAATNLEQTQFFDASSELKKAKQTVAPEILGSVLDRIDEMGHFEPQGRKQLKDLEPTELSLLDTGVLEDLLMVADIVTKAEPMFEDELYELEERFSRLAGISLDHSTIPVGVHTVCHAFAQAIDAVTLATEQRRVVFRALSDAVVSSLGQLYAELNTLLKTSGVLPDLRPGSYAATAKQARRDQSAQSGAARRQGSARSRPVEPGFPDAVEPDTVAAAPPAAASNVERAAYAGAGSPAQRVYHAARTLRALQRHMTQSTAQFDAIDADGGDRPGSTDRRAPADFPEQPLSARRGLPDSRRVFDADEILEALSALQQESEKPWTDQLEAIDLRTRLQELLKARRSSGQAKQIPEDLETALDMMSNLFESIAADAGLPARLRDLYRRLEIPLQKVAVIDPEVFDAKGHPARRLLNRMGELQSSLDPDATWDKELQQHLEQAVDKVAHGFDRDPAVFSEALGDLDRMASEHAKLYQANVQRLVKDLESQQAFLKSRRRGAEPQSAKRPAPDMPKEWEVWLNRAKRLQAGDALSLKQARGGAQRVLLAWVGEDFNPYVFVNDKGEKAVSMTLQELAMQLRRGTATLLDSNELPVVDRALYSTLFRMHDRIGQQALQDPATGLLNRKHFREQLVQAVEQAQHEEAVHTLAHVEVAGLKPIIDKFGTSAGAALLRRIGTLLNKPLNDAAVLGRIGAQDFGVLMEHYSSDEARAIADEQLGLIGKLRVKWKDQAFSLSPSMGLVVFTRGSQGADGLMAAAAGACIQARELTEPRLRVADAVPATPLEGEQPFDWGTWLERVTADGKLELFCQHIMPLGNDQGLKPQCQVIAAARRESDSDPLWLCPGQLESEPFAENARVFDRLLIGQTLAWMATQRKRLKGLACCVIPLCGHSLADEKLTETVLEQLTESAVPPGKVCFQLHEKAAVNRLGEAQRFVRTLKEFGCRFALDGMGSATTASGYLNSLPVDFLKIDGIFVADLGDSESDAAVIASVNEIAHLMGKKTVAQDVSNESALERLRTIGVDYGQGLCIEHAVALEEMR